VPKKLAIRFPARNLHIFVSDPRSRRAILSVALVTARFKNGE
jgi:hypothetical protein